MTEITLGLRITADGSAVVTSARQSVTAIEGVGRAAANANERAARSAGAATAATRRQADEAVAGATRQKDALAKVSEGFGGIEKAAVSAFGGIARFSIGALMAGWGVQVFETTRKFETLDLRLKGLTGNSLRFADAQAFITRTAQAQNVAVETLYESYTKLLPLQQSGLLTREQLQGLIIGFNDLKAATGASDAQLGQSLFGLAQGLSSGILRAEELNQVTEPLPGLLQKLDVAAGLAAGGFRKLVNEGKVTSEMFRDTLAKALQSYGGAAEKAAGTIDAALTRMGNAFSRLFNVPGLKGLFAGGANAIAAGAEFLAGDKRSGAADEIAELEKTIARLSQGRPNPVTGASLQAARDRLDRLRVQQLGEAQARDAEAVADVLNQDRTRREGIGGRADAALKEIDGNAEARRKLTQAERDLQAAIREGLDTSGKYAAALGQVRFQLDSLKDPVADQLKDLRDETRLLDVVGVERAKQEALLKAEQAAVGRGIPLSAEERGAVLAAADARYRKAQAVQAEAEALDRLDQAARAELANMADAERMRKQAIVERDQALRDRSKAIGGDLLDLRERRAVRAGDGATVWDIGIERAKRWKEEQLRGLDETAAGYQEFATRVQQVFEGQVEQAFRDAEEVSVDWRDGLRRGFRQIERDVADWGSFTADVITVSFRNGEEAFVRFVKKGKAEIGDLADFIIETFARIIYRKTIGRAIEGIVDDVLDILGGGGDPPAPMPKPAPEQDTVFAGIFHAGGLVGGPAPGRLVPAHVFEGAPRMHSGGVVGLSADERPIIARVGERVYTPAQDAARGTVVQIIDQRRGGAAVETEEETGPDGRQLVRVMVRDEVTGDLRRNGDIARAMQSQLGTRRTATVRG